MNSPPSIIDNLARIRERISNAAQSAGRNPNDITLVGVTKRKPADFVKTALVAGLTDIGENRVQEAQEKFPQLDLTGIKRHLIGHLQTNKVKFVPALFDVVHSIDSERVATALNQRLDNEDRTLSVFIQVNTSGEASKFGIEPDATSELIGICLEQPRLEVQGLMTIGPLTDDRKRIVASFQLLRQLAENLKQEYREQLTSLDLSMGMTDDFEWAIAEGATHVRVGRAIFGERE